MFFLCAKGVASVCDDVRIFLSAPTVYSFPLGFQAVDVLHSRLGEANERVFLTHSRKINADSFFCVYFLLQQTVAAGKCFPAPHQTGILSIFLARIACVYDVHIHHHARFDSLTNETPWTDFTLLRSMHACYICCSPDTFVRNSIDSVTTIRARINCTQREKSFDVPRLSACLKNRTTQKTHNRLHITWPRVTTMALNSLRKKSDSNFIAVPIHSNKQTGAHSKRYHVE